LVTPPRTPEDEAPAAGFFPWAVWLLAAIFYCYIFFVRVAPSVMVAELMREFSVNAAILGNLSAVYFYAYAGMQLPVGILHDRFGPRRVLTGAAMLCALGSLLFATAESLTMAYIGRLLIGAGAGFALVGTLKVASIWHPPRRFALLTGLAISFGMVGAIGAQAPLAAAVAVTGWRWSMVIAAAFSCVLAALIWLVVRDRVGPRPEAEPPGQPGALASLRDVMMTPQTWYMALIGGATGAPVLGFASLWGVPYMMEAYGIGRPLAALSTSLMLIGFAVGAPLFGWCSDRIGRRKEQLVAGCVVMLLSFVAAVYTPGIPLWLVQTLLFVNGLAVGSCLIAFAVAREHNRPGAVGTTTAVVNIMAVGGGGALQPIIGWILDLQWDGRMESGARLYSAEAYEAAFLTIAAFLAGSIPIALMVRETYCRQVRLAA
jgi:MFS family permease